MSEKHPAVPRDLLEFRADVARGRLSRTLSALDTRRHHATDVGFQVAHHKRALALAGAGLVLAVASSVTAAVLAARARRRGRYRARLEALQRLWRHPERVAVHAHDRPYPLQLAQKAGIAAATIALQQVLRRALAPHHEAHAG